MHHTFGGPLQAKQVLASNLSNQTQTRRKTAFHKDQHASCDLREGSAPRKKADPSSSSWHTVHSWVCYREGSQNSSRSNGSGGQESPSHQPPFLVHVSWGTPYSPSPVLLLAESRSLAEWPGMSPVQRCQNYLGKIILEQI